MSATENAFEKQLAAISPPYVSIVVPVYNVEATLYNCLLSVVHQTLTDVEVVIVNDASPDNSQSIIDEFVSRFPDRVRCVIHEQNQGLAYARRTGLRNAKAPYVVFVDSDDFISGELCFKLLEQIATNSLDMVYFSYLRCWDGSKKQEIMNPPLECSQNSLIKGGFAAFWSAIYRREFLLEHEQIAFLPMLFEDAAATPGLISQTDKIGVFRKKQLYFYRYGRTGSICAQQMSEGKMADTLAADEIGLANVVSSCRDSYLFRMIKRAALTVRNEPSIYDYAIFHLKKILKAEKNDQLDMGHSTTVQRLIAEAVILPDEIQIPKTVYVNGFMKDETHNFALYLEEAPKAYLFHPAVLTLDETNCNISLLPQWLKNASREEWGLYFAVREIAEHGGIYISPAVRMTTSFNREAFSGAFFVAGCDTSVLPCAFGGMPGNHLFQKTLESAQRAEVAWKRESLADCMSHVLIGESGVHLNGQEEYGLHQLHMLPFGSILRSTNPELSYCVLDYSNITVGQQEFIRIPKTLNDFAWELTTKEQKLISEEKETLKKEKKDALARAAQSERDLKQFKNKKILRLARRLYRLLPAWLKKLVSK